jgi:sRNA-binding regulator protein Hfq
MAGGGSLARSTNRKTNAMEQHINKPCKIYLISGACMSGSLLDINSEYAVMTTPSGGKQYIFKHAMATILPHEENMLDNAGNR